MPHAWALFLIRIDRKIDILTFSAIFASIPSDFIRFFMNWEHGFPSASSYDRMCIRYNRLAKPGKKTWKASHSNKWAEKQNAEPWSNHSITADEKIEMKTEAAADDVRMKSRGVSVAHWKEETEHVFVVLLAVYALQWKNAPIRHCSSALFVYFGPIYAVIDYIWSHDLHKRHTQTNRWP